MDNRFSDICLRPAPSRQLARVLAVLHLVVGGAILTAPVTLAVKLPLLLLLLLHGGWCKARYPGSVTEVRLEGDGHAFLEEEGRMLEATLRPDTLITPWVILLRFDLRHRRPLGVLICPDAIPGAQMCRLRTLLRFVVVSKGTRNSG